MELDAAAKWRTPPWCMDRAGIKNTPNECQVQIHQIQIGNCVGIYCRFVIIYWNDSIECIDDFGISRGDGSGEYVVNLQTQQQHTNSFHHSCLEHEEGHSKRYIGMTNVGLNFLSDF